MTDDDSADRYLQTLHYATSPGTVAVLATFAPDGPRQCSGFDVSRYDARDLSNLLGKRWWLVSEDHEDHRTPSGVVQPFTWAALRRIA